MLYQNKNELRVAKSYNKIHKIFKVPVEKCKIVSFASPIMKKNVVFAFPSRARFLVKLICSIAFGYASSACCLLISIAYIIFIGLLKKYRPSIIKLQSLISKVGI